MSITFEEITGEVGPERRRGRREDDQPQAGASDAGLDEKIRAALAREQRRVERLSDQ